MEGANCKDCIHYKPCDKAGLLHQHTNVLLNAKGYSVREEDEIAIEAQKLAEECSFFEN
ncbi:MAG: hypothetical protein GY853_13905 [PVC group bacterium]|nr:hypothetical protein [PVC group bacterium]